jgi:hypothetical protein
MLVSAARTLSPAPCAQWYCRVSADVHCRCQNMHQQLPASILLPAACICTAILQASCQLQLVRHALHASSTAGSIGCVIQARQGSSMRGCCGQHCCPCSCCYMHTRTCGAASLLMGANRTTSRGCSPSCCGVQGLYSSTAVPLA